MGNGLLPKEHGNPGIGPQRSKRPGNRFQPYGAGHVPGERPRQASNPRLEIPQLPRQRGSKSKSPSEASDIDEGYDSDPVEAYDVTWNQKAAAPTLVIMKNGILLLPNSSDHIPVLLMAGWGRDL